MELSSVPPASGWAERTFLGALLERVRIAGPGLLSARQAEELHPVLLASRPGIREPEERA